MDEKNFFENRTVQRNPCLFFVSFFTSNFYITFLDPWQCEVYYRHTYPIAFHDLFFPKQSTRNEFFLSPANEQSAPVEISVLKFHGILSHGQSDCGLFQNSPGLSHRFQVKVFQGLATIGIINNNKELMLWKYIWKK